MKKVPVNPEILKWARENAGLTLEEAARKLKINKAYGMEPVQRMMALEDGTNQPSRTNLLNMAKQYHRPLITFYLEFPPEKGDRGEDFRRLPDNYTQADDALVDALLRDVRARQDIVKAVLADEDELEPIPFVGAATIEEGIDHSVNLIRSHINFDLKKFRAQDSFDNAFNYLRSCAESAGVFVLLIGNLGSSHTKIASEIFRGFAIADSIVPFVIINDQDSKAAWSFTLLHELAHLCLGQTGISGDIPETKLEQFCNDVAGSILLSNDDLHSLDITDQTDLSDAVDQINEFASTINVSRPMVAYKIFRNGKISYETWNKLRIEFRKQWLQHVAEKRKKNREKDSGPDYYTVRKHRMGLALVTLVSRMVSSGAMTDTKAGKVLGVKPKNVHQLVSMTN